MSDVRADGSGPIGRWSNRVRTGRGSRQRVVAYLGELARSEQSGWAQLGRSLSGKQRPSPSLFDPPHYDDPSDDEPVLVDLRGVRLERLRDFGDVWMALGLWRLLGLDTLLQSLAEPGRRRRSLAGGGRHFDDRPVLQAIQRVAHRNDVVSRHGVGGPAGRAGGKGPHRPAVRGLGLAAAAQGRRSRSISRSGWERCSIWSTTCCCTT